jgi:hypothetical protein
MKKSKKNYLISSDTKNKLFILIRKNIFNLLYLYSAFSVILTFILLYFLSSADHAVDFLVISSFIMIITQIFSSNIRNIAIIDKNVRILKYHFKFRLFISLLIIISFFVIKKYFIDYKDSTLYFCILIFVLSFWIYELRIAFNELKKFKKDSFIALFSHAFLYLFFLILLFFINEKISLSIYLIATSLINIFYFSVFFLREKNFKKIVKIKYTNEKYIQFYNLAFSSSLTLTLTTFIIRFFLNKEFDDNLVADVLFSIAISNFPASLISTTFGASYLNRDVSLPIIFKYLFKIYTLLLLISIFLFVTNFYPSYKEFFKILSYSLIGGFFMFFAQAIRILNLGILYNRKSVFLRDIIFSLVLLLDLFVCIYFKKIYLLYFSYSFFAIVIYSIDYKLHAINKKL